MTENAYEGWTILELMGHRRLGGYVSEVEIAGAKMLRIDVHAPNGASATQFYSPNAVYAMTPTTEEIAKEIGRHAPAPVSRWDLPALTSPGNRSVEYEEQEDDD